MNSASSDPPSPVPRHPSRLYESPSDLPEAIRLPVYDLLLSLADNKYMLGLRYAEWSNPAPTIESGVAAASMAQDELGHARSFYTLLKEFPEGAKELGEVDERRDEGFALRALQKPFASWLEFVVANDLIDRALTVFLDSAQNSSFIPLRQRARKIVSEETFHRMHAEGWLKQLAGYPKGREQLSTIIGGVWQEALCWFGRDDIGIAFTDAGICDASPKSLRAQYLSQVVPALERGGIRVPPAALDESVWKCWAPRARRFL